MERLEITTTPSVIAGMKRRHICKLDIRGTVFCVEMASSRKQLSCDGTGCVPALALTAICLPRLLLLAAYIQLEGLSLIIEHWPSHPYALRTGVRFDSIPSFMHRFGALFRWRKLSSHLTLRCFGKPGLHGYLPGGFQILPRKSIRLLHIVAQSLLEAESLPEMPNPYVEALSLGS
ncbi:hypothetical protein GQ53DRAFT_750176 [Thozetella sp. PMI_491]|nr:hypothetical protein GQ53DRAFT_750176 [Thozetella sp. PMI_491]